MDELKNCTKYITNKSEFINDFISYLNKANYNERNNYFKLTPREIGNEIINGVFIEVLYGRNGREFLTIDQYNNEEKHDEKTKYICYYKIYFFVVNNNLFMVTFKQSGYGCKTAVSSQMQQFLAESNVVVNTDVVSNEKYISEILESADVQQLTFSSVYSKDDGEKEIIEKEVFSNISLELKVENKVPFLKGIKDTLKRIIKGETRHVLMTELQKNYSINDCLIDEDSLKMTILYNGVKRIISLNDFENTLYDIDITKKIKYNEKGYPIQSSVDELIIDYVIGLPGVSK